MSCSLFAAKKKDLSGIKSDIQITSKTLDYDKVKSVATFRGDVLVISGDIKLEAQKMVCRFTKKNVLIKIIAEGKVKVTKGKQILTAGKAEYHVKTELIHLTRNPKIHDGPNALKARKIEIDRNKKKIRFEEPEGQMISTKKDSFKTK